MTLYDIVIARESLQKLITKEMPVRQAYQVALLVDKLNVSLKFYGDQMFEIALMDEDAAEYRKAELEAMEIPGADGFPDIRIPLDSALQLSASDIKCLTPFVTFYEPPQAVEGGSM